MRFNIILSILIVLLLSSCKMNNPSTQEIDMYNVDSDLVGTATFIEQAEGVKIKIKIEGLEPGFHGAHIHEFPLCEGPSFASSGNHFNPEGKKHGLMNPEGAHLGDLPNVEADESGLVEAELLAPEATLLEGKNSFLKDEGVSFIITAEQDDGMSQPSGDSGERLICGKLTNDQNKPKESPTDPTESGDEEKEES